MSSAAVVILSLLALTGVQSQEDMQVEIRDALSVVAQRWSLQYYDIALGTSPLSDTPMLQDCYVDPNSQQFGLINDRISVLQNPSRLTSLYVTAQLNDTWRELSANFTGVVQSLHFTDALGGYIHGYTSLDAKNLCQGGAQSYDGRKQPGYVQSLSSPKPTIILNLLTQQNSETSTALDAINTILNFTLTPVDYFGVYSNGIDTEADFRTSIVKADPTNITLIQTRLQEAAAANNLLSPDFNWLDRTALQADLELSDDNICVHSLIVLLDADIPTDIQSIISRAAASSPSLTVFVYSFADASSHDNIQELVCGGNTVLYDRVGQRSDFGLINYLNYFVTAFPPPEPLISPAPTGLLGNPIDASVCIPLFDILLSTTPTLMGVLCAEVKSDDFSNVEFSRTAAECPPLPVSDPFQFSLLISNYRDLMDPIPFYCPDATSPPDLHFSLTPLVLSLSRAIGVASEIVTSDFVTDTCPVIQGVALTSNCLASGDPYQSDPNFNLPISLVGSSLLWPTRLDTVLPLVSSDFNTLNSTLPLWQDVCTTAYLDHSWQSIFFSLPPLTAIYGDYATGYTRSYPGYRATTETCASLDTNDAKLESWFAFTASGPKALAILIDVEFNIAEDFQSIITAATALLNILSQYDYYTIISTDQSGSLFSDLVPATEANIAIGRDFIGKFAFDVNSRDPTLAVSIVQQMYNAALFSIPTTVNYALVVLSDNSFVDVSTNSPASHLEPIADFLEQSKIRVFSYLFSQFEDGTSLKSISCGTGGLYNRLTGQLSDYNIGFKVAVQYYSFYASNTQSPFPLWLEYFTDEVTGENSTRVCSNIYPDIFDRDSFNTLLGVTCIHLPVSKFSPDQLMEVQHMIYNAPPHATPLNLTADQENSLRGDETCDFSPPPPPESAEAFRMTIEERVHVFRTFIGETYEAIVAPSVPLSQCPYGDGLFYDSCNATVAPGVVQNVMYGCGVNTSESSFHVSSTLAPFVRQLGYRLEDPFYPVDSPLFQQICLSEALGSLWSVPDFREQPGVLWYYYGDSFLNTLTFHPYSDCGRDDDSFCISRSYQPKFTPWYASTVSGSKNVYIVIHATDQTNFQAMINGALYVIDTLSHRDFVNVRFASRLDPLPHYGDGSLLPASNATRTEIKDFVRKHQFYAGTSLNTTDIFLAFLAAQTSQTARCHQVLILLIDSTLPETLPSQITTQQAVLASPVDIFTYTLGDPAINHLIAQEISCENRGEWFPVGDPSQVQLDITNYYKFYSAAIQDSDTVIWTDYYTDVLTGKSLIAACLPVYDPQRIGEAPMLIGVTCVDVDPDYFLTLTDGEQVLASLVSADNAVCPSQDITDEVRESLRNIPCSIITPSPPTGGPGGGSIDLQLATDFYRATIPTAVSQHEEAFDAIAEQLETATKPFSCPYGNLQLFDLCNLEQSPDLQQYFSPSDEYGGRDVSYDGIGAVLAPHTAGYLNNGSITLDNLQSDQPLFNAICPALTEEAFWTTNRQEYNFTSLQLFISDTGVALFYPAVAQGPGVCDQLDTRLNQYYAAVTSAYKDVVIIVDLQSPPATFITSVPSEALQHILFSTLAENDYFNIIAGGSTLFTEAMQRSADGAALISAAMFLSELKYATSSQDQQIASGFAMLKQLWDSRSQNGVDLNANCQPAIVLLTDREFSQASVDQIATDNSKFEGAHQQRVKFFINSFGVSSSSMRELGVTCDNSGVWNIISAEEYGETLVIQQKVSSYAYVLADVITHQAPLWTSGVLASLGLPGIAICNPVYGGGKGETQLVGSGCVVVTDELLSLAANGNELRIQLLSNEHTQAFSTCATLQDASSDRLDKFRPQGMTCESPTIEPTPTDRPSTSITTSTSSTTSDTSSSPSSTDTSTTSSSSSSDSSSSTDTSVGPSQTPGGTDPNEGTTDASSSEDKGLGSGEIVAIVFGVAGVLFGVSAIVFAILVYMKLKTSKSLQDTEQERAGHVLREHLLEDGEARESHT